PAARRASDRSMSSEVLDGRSKSSMVERTPRWSSEVETPRLPGVTAQDLAQEAADTLARLTGVARHDVALVLGSGWLPAAASLGDPTAEIDSTALARFFAAR